MSEQFDVIVVGAGHAGVEAAMASARLNAKTLVVTTNVSRIGYMSCNPSIGGLGKGHIVKEIDALGGLMGRAADINCVQFKKLNSRKGPAVRGTRMQEDKDKYCDYVGKTLSSHPNIQILENEAKSLILESDRCVGLVLDDGSRVLSKTVVITTGTFLNAVMHIGKEKISGGRVGDKASTGLSDQLAQFGFNVRRLKTGTPPRLKKSSLLLDRTQAENGDEGFVPFSFASSNKLNLKQIQCYLTYTNEQTHQIIRDNLHLSPMYSGEITGTGPRYCPSIEDKITRFADKDRHQSFLEPEGVDSDIIYLQGISTSLPADIQEKFLKTIPGLEQVEIIRPGYAVEYDFVEPTQLKKTLETKYIENLYLAGQINGTSGYEEAGGQGLIAGVNAAHNALSKDIFVLERYESYIGVLIDDLVTKGTKEPYRMFTSRAEHRLFLREDNALDRLFQKAKQNSLLSTQDIQYIDKVLTGRTGFKKYLSTHSIYPNSQTNTQLVELGMTQIAKQYVLRDYLKRPDVDCMSLKKLKLEVPEDFIVYDPVEIEVKYEGYIGRQLELIKQAKKLEDYKIPDSIIYSDIKGLSNEEKEKLSSLKPITIGQASRISGVNPSAIQSLMIHLKAYKPPKHQKHPGRA